MNLEYKYLLDGNFHHDSRVWIYQSSRLFLLSEALEIELMLKEFVAGWLSHGVPVKGAGYLFFGQFIVLVADETTTGVSGCSTDSSVRLIKGIEKKFGVDMFDRFALAFVVKDKSDRYRIQLLPMQQLQYAIDNGFISADTLFFNNVVQSKKELEENWIIPVKDSWLGRRINILKAI
jgi:hypothetical protein